MPKFIHDDFLLESDEARTLYHDYARDLPIIDYHSHLPIADIASDRPFANLTQVWLAGDHYKWRAMRTWGVDERLITGDAGDAEKFAAWAAVVPHTLRNPLYHWTHLELARYFGIDDLLGPHNAEEVYAACNAQLARPECSAVGLLKGMRVEVLCTTDDPTDDLGHHQTYLERGGPAVYPAWRPDKALRIEHPAEFNTWVDVLGQAVGLEITSFERLLEALDIRQQAFHAAGCRLADHGIATVPVADYTAQEVAAVFAKVRGGARPTPEEAAGFQAAMLLELCRMNHTRGWTQQLHFGVLRNVNTRMFAQLGPDTGFDSIGDFRHAAALACFLDKLDREDKLSRTILYNSNPADNAVVASMLGNFQEDIQGKLQFGSAWWFLDQRAGIEAQLNDLSAMGLIAAFVGMTTDSRSFLSFPRHEYFRRILCNLFGADMHKGLIPADMELVGGIVRDICYYNARHYFGFTQAQDEP